MRFWIIIIILFFYSLLPPDQYSDIPSLRAPLFNGPPQDCRAMYNPMTPGVAHGSGPGPAQSIGHCLDQYMRPPQAPLPLGVMGHRNMASTEAQCKGSLMVTLVILEFFSECCFRSEVGRQIIQKLYTKGFNIVTSANPALHGGGFNLLVIRRWAQAVFFSKRGRTASLCDGRNLPKI